MKKNGKPTKRKSKYDEKIHIDTTPEKLAETVFRGKPKPRGEWDFIRKDQGKRG